VKRENTATWIDLGLLATVFLLAAGRVLTRPSASGAADDGRIVLRFAHWQLESGLRDALDELAREYEASHPHVRIEQVPVPNRTYAQWLQTRLIGDTATDIIQLPRSLEDETLARYFLPLTAEVEQPNPYNAGTDLAELPWRETFVDGLGGAFSYRPTLLEYYGIPMSMLTVRIYYNRDLWKRLVGDTPPPADYESFRAICAKAAETAKREDLPAIPLVGSFDNGPILISRFVGSQTQRLAAGISRSRTLVTTQADINLGYLRGEWTTREPALDAAFSLAREVSLLMQPGYTQLRHEDATFHFTQGRALMVTSGSWDAPVFRALCDFGLGVFDIPIPDASHPRYGPQVLGPASEADSSTGMAFAVALRTPHRAEAVDFLRFLTSRAGNSAFSRRSGWLPSVVGVTPTGELAPFLPRIEGHPAGFGLGFGNGSAINQLVSRANTLLISHAGSVEKYRLAIEEDLDAAFRHDLGRSSRNQLMNISRQDILLAGHLGARDAEAAPAGAGSERLSALTESQNQQESLRAWIEFELARNPAR
jgi:raffinose/stachyose/melibiose transport system substrate-binding protein